MGRLRFLAVAVSFFMVMVLVVAVSGFAQQGAGGPAAVPQKLREKAKVDQEWEKLADTNKDGIVDSVEIRQWKQRSMDNKPASEMAEAVSVPESTSADQGVLSSGAQEASQVNRPWEKAADTNQDGIVDEVEINQWNQRGNNPPGMAGGPGSGQGPNVQQAAEVNRPWEKAADVNKDGSVGRKEFGQWNKQGNNPPGRAGGPGQSGVQGQNIQGANRGPGQGGPGKGPDITPSGGGSRGNPPGKSPGKGPGNPPGRGPSGPGGGGGGAKRR